MRCAHLGIAHLVVKAVLRCLRVSIGFLNYPLLANETERSGSGLARLHVSATESVRVKSFTPSVIGQGRRVWQWFCESRILLSWQGMAEMECCSRTRQRRWQEQVRGTQRHDVLCKCTVPSSCGRCTQDNDCETQAGKASGHLPPEQIEFSRSKSSPPSKNARADNRKPQHRRIAEARAVRWMTSRYVYLMWSGADGVTMRANFRLRGIQTRMHTREVYRV